MNGRFLHGVHLGHHRLVEGIVRKRSDSDSRQLVNAYDLHPTVEFVDLQS